MKGGKQMFYRILIICFILVAPGILFASPGGPDRDKHPYVGMLVCDLGNDQIYPYGHITLISGTEAVIANHLAIRGEDITFTLDNPVILPANLLSGTVRIGGFDFSDFAVDIAIVDLHTPVELPRYAQLPSGPISHDPGMILDFVTYVAVNRANLMMCGGIPSGKYLQNEPGNVDYDRNIIRTPTVRPRKYFNLDSTKQFTTANVTCFGHSGSPILLKGTDIIAGVLSMGGYRCLGGGDSIFARTDNELALGILTGTVPLPPPPTTAYPRFIQGSGPSGLKSFLATTVAGAEYSASVIGLAPATESAGTVAQEDITMFTVSITPGFRFFVAELFNDFTSGNDDLDLWLAWKVKGEEYYEVLFFSEGPTSDEFIGVSEEDLLFYEGYVEDIYSFEIVVYGWFTENPTSDFTLFSWELENVDEGNMNVSTVTADPDDPVVEIDVNWSALDLANKKYFGIIEHFIDGVPDLDEKSTFVQIDIAP
jgi:hypothetical protein